MLQDVDFIKVSHSKKNSHLVLWLIPILLTAFCMLLLVYWQYQHMAGLKSQWNNLLNSEEKNISVLNSEKFTVVDNDVQNSNFTVSNILSYFIGQDFANITVNTIEMDQERLVKISGVASDIDALSEYIGRSKNNTFLDGFDQNQLSVINDKKSNSIQWLIQWQ